MDYHSVQAPVLWPILVIFSCIREAQIALRSSTESASRISSISWILSSMLLIICSCLSDSVSFSTLSIHKLILPITLPRRAFMSLRCVRSSSCWYIPSISDCNPLISSSFFSRSCSNPEIKERSFGCSRVTFDIDLSRLAIEALSFQH